MQAFRPRDQRLFARRGRLVNILFTKCESIVNAYLIEVSIPAISLRTDGIVRPISGCGQLQHKFTLSANQLMEITLATYNFKRDENRKYDQIVRRLNKPNDSPIHFAFTTDYDDAQNAHIAAHIYSRKKLAKQCGAAKRANAIVIQVVDTANFGDAKEKRLATFRIVDCPPMEQSSVVSRSSSLSLTKQA